MTFVAVIFKINLKVQEVSLRRLSLSTRYENSQQRSLMMMDEEQAELQQLCDYANDKDVVDTAMKNLKEANATYREKEDILQKDENKAYDAFNYDSIPKAQLAVRKIFSVLTT